MSEYIPPIFTPMHDSEINIDVPAHEEVMKKLIANFNFVGNLLPVGAVIFVNVNNVGVSIPNPNVWQECNGSKITHPDSPLRSVGVDEKFTPNLQNKYVRCATQTLTTLPTGGNQSFDLEHDHLGGTGNDDPPGPDAYESSGDRRIRVTHSHSIDSDLQTTITVDAPAYMRLVAYMKIA
jgi:hypothetical protein